MRLTDILQQATRPFPTLEIVPPSKGIAKEELLASLEPLMEFQPRLVNVTCHRDEIQFRPEPDGSWSRHIVRNRVSETAVCGAILSRFNVEVVPHLICAGATKEEIESSLYDFRFMGIRHVMALRGDGLAGEKRFTPTPGGYAHADGLVAGIRAFEEEHPAETPFCIGVGGYPEKHAEAANLETDIANLAGKVAAGADYIITQMFFDNRVFYDFERRCREAGITVPILPGLKPLSTARQIDLLPETFSLDIPLALTRAVREAGADKEAVYRIGTQWCIDQCRDLLAHGVPAVHFYTMGRSRNITTILRACF